jgi:hypothetical protein
VEAPNGTELLGTPNGLRGTITYRPVLRKHREFMRQRRDAHTQSSPYTPRPKVDGGEERLQPIATVQPVMQRMELPVLNRNPTQPHSLH